MIKNILFITAIFTLSVASANAYGVDGNVLTDWGIDLYAPGADTLGYLNSHTPSGSNVDKITEDNADMHINPARNDYWWNVGPGWSINNDYDAEAMYFDNNSTNAYIALITGVKPGEGSYPTGDIGLDINLDGIYEYGIDVRSYNAATKQTRLYQNLTNVNWRGTNIFTDSNPWEVIHNGTSPSYTWIDFVYSGEQNTHYVMEAGIPLSYLGLNAEQKHNLALHWTMKCGNDTLNLNADVDAVPEPATMSLLGLGLLGLLKFKRKKVL